MDRQQNNIMELSDIFEPDMYNGRLHHLPSINVMLASHLGAAGSDNVSVTTAYSLSKRRNSDSSAYSAAESPHADFDDFEMVDYDTVYAQSQEELIHREDNTRGYSLYPTSTIKAKKYRRRQSSFSKLRVAVGGLLQSRQRN
ncbi:hypothetical protein GGI01_001698 [Coemansia sp. RSA 376]|nr:hypothetical protein H4S03_004647 [Coemansia sp. S3946]KAJ2110894.1 hypothetical protein IW146_005709 [Coemansia sp. RSA 922]KAJ2262228.1 hypothetical protein GGI01_001698 [Coemansia sp. RSA 376]KAJ2460378.1 hypothetical protein GGI03_005302 [Coemansia sp. RSA 2337]